MLSFEEKPIRWTDGAGRDRFVEGCVEVIGRATVDWASRPEIDALIPNEKVLGRTPGAREWWVTEYVEQWARRERPRNGFVLRGGLEQLDADDDLSCLSEISKPTLRVTYVVPD